MLSRAKHTGERNRAGDVRRDTTASSVTAAGQTRDRHAVRAGDGDDDAPVAAMARDAGQCRPVRQKHRASAVPKTGVITVVTRKYGRKYGWRQRAHGANSVAHGHELPATKI